MGSPPPFVSPPGGEEEKTVIESLSGERRRINIAYLVMVALDDRENPVEVPRLRLETEQQRRDWEAGSRRRQERLARPL